MTDSVTPHDLPAERSLIGAVLIDPARLMDARAVGILPAHFFRLGHDVIWRAMLHLADAGEPIDLRTVTTRLREAGTLEEAGGPADIAAMTDGVPRAANAGAYAGIIVRKAKARSFMAALRQAHETAATSGAEAALDTLSPYLQDATPRSILRVRTGLDLIDSTDPEPLHPNWPMLVRGGITALVGASGTGKTYLVLRMIADLLRSGKRVLLCALEGVGGLKRRLLALCAAFGLEDDDMQRLIVIDALQLGDPASLRAAVTAAGGPVDAVFGDTFARALGDLDENSANAVGAALNGGARLSRDLGDAAVLLVHHTNRSTSSERGSGAFRAGVDCLAFFEDEGEQRVLRIDKMRDGEPPAPRVFRFRTVPECGSAVLDDADRVLPAGTESELSIKTQQVLRELRMVGRATASEMADSLRGRVGRTTIFGALQSLEKLGLARQDRGTWSVPNPASPVQSGHQSGVSSNLFNTESGKNAQ